MRAVYLQVQGNVCCMSMVPQFLKILPEEQQFTIIVMHSWFFELLWDYINNHHGPNCSHVNTWNRKHDRGYVFHLRPLFPFYLSIVSKIWLVSVSQIAKAFRTWVKCNTCPAQKAHSLIQIQCFKTEADQCFCVLSSIAQNICGVIKITFNKIISIL